MCGGVWWCLDHVWWCLVVSGACLVVSGARLVMLMDIDWYDLIWCIWADIFSNAYNRCTDAADAADALMLLINWCYWSNDAAVVDKMQICVWAHLKGKALSSEFRTVVQCLVIHCHSLTRKICIHTFPRQLAGVAAVMRLNLILQDPIFPLEEIWILTFPQQPGDDAAVMRLNLM